MTQLAEEKSIHLENFARFQRQGGVDGHAWLERLRRDAIARFEASGFPSSTDEHWRHTNFNPIIRTPFVLACSQSGQAVRSAAGEYSFGGDAIAELVFVNGSLVPELSRTEHLPKGVRIGSLAEALAGNSAEIVAAHLGKHAGFEHNPFVALNTGFIRDGAFIHIPRNAVVGRPIHLLFIGAPSDQPTVAHPRVLVIADENCEATLVESYVGSGSGVYLTNAVTEIVAGPNARIDHCKLQQANIEAFHVATMRVMLDRSANFVSHSATLGGRITRNDLEVVMNGEGADATLNGLVLVSGQQHCDNHTLLQHEKPNCSSHELYKHVLDGRSSGVFKGKIFVQKNAQKTDSKQTSKSLLLSDDATMNSQPALEIYADDVKCTHGSTIGPVDEEQVFYLRSRGVPLEAARHLLTYAFAADITRRIRVEPVRRRLEDFMAAQHGLPQDLRITDLGAHDEAAL